MKPKNLNQVWAAVHAERAALAEDLAGLSDDQWAVPSLCGQWVVEEVVAHLTAAASIGALRWVSSMLGAGLNADLHNRRRLEEQRGATPTETLTRFRAVIGSTKSPSKHTAAWLGEVIVHSQDIRRPLGLQRTPAVDAVTEVAQFFAARDFAVPSHSAVKGLRLEATDGPFHSGSGPLVSGTTLALAMAMAGRETYCDDLTGDGVLTMRSRCTS
jgi:uncharacterized protein (TIGR03083 family)